MKCSCLCSCVCFDCCVGVIWVTMDTAVHEQELTAFGIRRVHSNMRYQEMLPSSRRSERLAFLEYYQCMRSCARGGRHISRTSVTAKLPSLSLRSTCGLHSQCRMSFCGCSACYCGRSTIRVTYKHLSTCHPIDEVFGFAHISFILFFTHVGVFVALVTCFPPTACARVVLLGHLLVVTNAPIMRAH